METMEVTNKEIPAIEVFNGDSSASTKQGDIRPYATPDDVVRLVCDVYGLKVQSIKQLVGYDDQNFHVMVDGNIENKHVSKIHQPGYVVKILHRNDSQAFKDHLSAQIAMTIHVCKNGVSCPQTIMDKDGNYFSEHLLPNKERTGFNKHIVRVLQFIDGITLGSLAITPELTLEGGTFLGDFQSALDGFSDERLRRDNYLWNLLNVTSLSSYVHSIADEDERKLAQDMIEKWEAVSHRFKPLRFGPVHHDFNEQNIIVSKKDGGGYQFEGILDFQDSCYGYRVFDIAVYMMYMMTFCTAADPIDVGGYCLAGYLRRQKLLEEELDVLYYCIVGRFLQSLIMGAYNYSLHKDPYLLVTQRPGWKVLKMLCANSPHSCLERWRGIANNLLVA